MKILKDPLFLPSPSMKSEKSSTNLPSMAQIDQLYNERYHLMRTVHSSIRNIEDNISLSPQ